jgi:hypothetical protein
MVSQSAFDMGFPVGMSWGRRIGLVLGVLEIIVTADYKELGQEIKARAAQELDGMSLWRDERTEIEMIRRGIGHPAGDLMLQQRHQHQQQAHANGNPNPDLIWDYSTSTYVQQGQIHPPPSPHLSSPSPVSPPQTTTTISISSQDQTNKN